MTSSSPLRGSRPAPPPEPQGPGRLLLPLGLAVVVGGAGLAYVWSTLNAALLGTVGAARVASALLVVLLLIGLLTWLARFLARLAPRD